MADPTASPADAELDLARYAARIGLALPAHPDAEGLQQLIEHHAQAIAFENIDAIAGRQVPLTASALQAKLVDRLRGGYCFEHNSLMQHALSQLGYDVVAREARVLTAQTDIGQTTRTHMVLQVLLDGVPVLVDVGFGALAPLRAMPFDGEERLCADGRWYRLGRVPGGDLLEFREDDADWAPAYRLEPTRPGPADLQMAHWYASTAPAFFLRRNLSLGRAVPDGRLSLFNRTLSLRLAGGGPPERTVLRSRAELADALRDGFGLAIDEADIDRVLALFDAQEAEAAATAAAGDAPAAGAEPEA